MMDGKFAFVLYDETTKFLMIGRDQIGLCPLYWGKGADGEIMISSELKSLEGICDNYQIFPPGHVYTNDLGLERWYNSQWLT